MLLRYKYTDYMTYNEDELLFNGSAEECEQYLLKNWSVDIQELKDNLELQATMCDYLRHIYFDKTEFKTDGKYTPIGELEGLDYVMNTDTWHKIDCNKYIFNREIIDVIYS